LNWLANIKDWCISRQIWWGHQLPVCFFKDKQTETSEELFVVADKKPKKCPFCKKCEMEQSQDVLDTWFSSALWPFATLGWPNKKSKDYVNFYPTQFLSTARDILNLWVSRMIFSGMEFTGKAPFKDVYIHATVLTKDGRRMSKSLGTGIDPIELIEKYGADATRFGLIYQAMGGQDIRFNEDILVTGKKFCNKIWNASRFVLMQLENIKGVSVKDISKLKPKTSEDKKIINRTKSVFKSIEKDINGYKFGQAAHTMYDFFWHDFCDVYIEYAKLKDDTNTKEILISVLSASLKIMQPFIPFATEEIYSSLPGKNKSLLIVEDWPAK
jgi:valyl-tRNA synthetase